MTIQEYANKYGARKTAIKLVSYTIYQKIGLSVDDLPDTSELCNMYDDLEELIEDGYEENKEQVKDILSQIDDDFIINQALN